MPDDWPAVASRSHFQREHQWHGQLFPTLSGALSMSRSTTLTHTPAPASKCSMLIAFSLTPLAAALGGFGGPVSAASRQTAYRLGYSLPAMLGLQMQFHPVLLQRCCNDHGKRVSRSS
jgi:hypothetical protein